MKRILFIAVAALLLTGCKKIIKQTQEQIAESLILKAMTDGTWMVSVYNDGTTEYKPEFDTYEFRFYKNYNVDAIKNSATEITGTWREDVTNLTITSQYGVNANPTVQRLNGVWKMKDSNWTWVKATQTINGNLTTLELRKK